MRSIAELLNAHAGQVAWIFGKGPGLDNFDFSSASSPIICINESLLAVSSADYFFAHDERPIERVSKVWPIGCKAVLQPSRCSYAAHCGIPSNDLYSYEKRDRDLSILSWTPEQIARNGMLLGMTGTVHSALHFCKLIAAHSVILVGMDGVGGYAKCLGIDAPKGGGRHHLIRQDSVRIAESLQLEIRFAESC